MTPEEIFADMVADGDVVLDRLDQWAREDGDKVFIHYGEDGVRLGFAEFKRRTDGLAAGLAAAGVAPGDRVSVLTRNSLLATLSMFAIWRTGAIYAPVNFNYRGKLLSYQLQDTAPAALITDVAHAAAIGEVIGELDIPRYVLHRPAPGDHDHAGEAPAGAFGDLPMHDFAGLCDSDGPPPAVALGPFDPANIVYTSGTTGPAKGVLQGHRWMNQYTMLTRRMSDRDDVLYCDLPLYHVGGAFSIVARACWMGITVGLWDRFSPNRFWERIAECGATSCILLDVMVPWLMSAPKTRNDRANTLKKVHMQPLPSNHHEVARRFGFDFVSVGFGQTETGAGFAALIDQFGDAPGTPPEMYRGMPKRETREIAGRYGIPVVDGAQKLPKGFMGRPSPLLEAAILDPDDNRCADGQVGQLAFRPRFPGLMLQAYFNKPETTLKAFRNLWFHTGDACIRDPDGTFRFVDRMGGFLRVRGENVSSYQIEDLINDHPRVRATAALPVPAREGGEEDIAVFVQPVEGHKLTEAEIREHARRVMPRYMVPRHVRIVDALPLTPTNKVEKYKLRKQLLSELGKD